jgi:glycosyltransferase involved in cell wall biosynthesis
MDYPLRRGLRSHLLYNLAVHAVAAISQGVRDQLVAGGVTAGRIRVIESGVEAPAELPGASGRRAARERFGADGEVVIAVVAALVRRKAHDILLRALAELRERDVSVVCLVCGDGEERGALESLVRSLDLGRQVRFLGRRSQVADVLAAADVFVLPSRHEGLGVAILEAMAMALPVVASRVGGIPEAVVHEETGILVPAEDAAALAAAIRELSASAALRARMGARGRERVLARFTMERMAERYEALYRDVHPVARGPAEVE